MGIAKRVLALTISAGLKRGQCAIPFDSLCGGRTGVPKCPLTISVEIEQGLENVY